MNRSKLITPMLATAALAGTTLASGIANAGTTEVTSVASAASALDIEVDVNGTVIDVGPTPLVEMNDPSQKGSITSPGANIAGLISTGLTAVSTDGAMGEDGFSAARTTIAETDVAVGLVDILDIEALTTECRHDGATGGGMTTILNGSTVLGSLEQTPDPNTVVTIPGVATLTLNRQVTQTDGTIEVTGVALDIDLPSIAIPADGTIDLAKTNCNAEVSDATTTPNGSGPSDPSSTPNDDPDSVSNTNGNSPVQGTPTATG